MPPVEHLRDAACVLDLLHVLPEHALPAPGLDQLYPGRRQQVAALADLRLRRAVRPLGARLPADLALDPFHLACKQAQQQRRHGFRHVRQVDARIAVARHANRRVFSGSTPASFAALLIFSG
jgi:hypothetical protein